jgi:AcrR family transcriptional regulator
MAKTIPKKRLPNRTTAEPHSNSLEQLLDAALTVFADKGYEATSIRDIQSEAKVTAPTIYHYFPNKQSLFLHLVEIKYRESLRLFEAILEQEKTCRGRLRKILLRSFEVAASDPRVTRLLFQTAFGPRIETISETLDALGNERFKMVTRLMREAVAARELARSDIDGLALAFCSLLDHHLNVLSRQKKPSSYFTPKLADWLLKVFLHGTAE